jgi:hypothetical protein
VAITFLQLDNSTVLQKKALSLKGLHAESANCMQR